MTGVQTCALPILDYISYLDESKVDGAELFDDNLIFDPDFNSTNFLNNTMTYFNALGLMSDGKKRK